MALADLAMADYTDMGIDSNGNRDNSNRDIHIDIEGILGMSDIPDITSCPLADL
jgi:hypothetical protein